MYRNEHHLKRGLSPSRILFNASFFSALGANCTSKSIRFKRDLAHSLKFSVLPVRTICGQTQSSFHHTSQYDFSTSSNGLLLPERSTSSKVSGKDEPKAAAARILVLLNCAPAIGATCRPTSKCSANL